MTTITPYMLNEMCVIAGTSDAEMRAALTAAGITIAEPEPPAAMVRLAREICIPVLEADDWPPRVLDEILRGEGDDVVAVQAALAALQHAAKVVRDEESPSGRPADVVYRYSILYKLGAEQ